MNKTVFFPSYISGSFKSDQPTVASSSDDDAPQIKCQQTMLFVHKLAWQKRLLCHYGQDMCLLEAAYKTCKYVLPLFFLCVETNVEYQVVATFILENEAEADIAEALNILRNWNPLWKPSYFMT